MPSHTSVAVANGASVPLTRSALEFAPVKIDLLKGQQPLNLPSQEAFSAVQGDGTRRAGWRQHAAFLPNAFQSVLIDLIAPQLCACAWKVLRRNRFYSIQISIMGCDICTAGPDLLYDS